VPKGVCISHRNALAFVEWARDAIAATGQDRFANHAPFHFDLSVLDLYVAFAVGASVHLIPDGMAYAPRRLVEFLDDARISILYVVPSVLALLEEQADLMTRPGLALRAVLFAGEPCPIRVLRRMRQAWPLMRLWNLYGPTETNVCTAYEVHDVPEERVLPVPIGQAVSGDRVWAVRADGAVVGPGEEGELLVEGPTVMLGYWGREPQGGRPYATGDLVRRLEDGNYQYVGRRDHMVKVRGHRIELGDVEAALGAHPDVREVAVVVRGEGTAARLVAVVAAGARRPHLLELKRHCAERLPRFMIVDDVNYLEALPRTRNGKVDRIALGRTASAREGAATAAQGVRT
jgi:clorobiocin biosynthesis protein CloN4